MGKNKTIYTWIILVLVAISVVFGLLSFVSSLLNLNRLLTPSLFNSPVANIITLTLSFIGFGISIVYLYKLYNVTPDCIIWTHVKFGYSILTSLASAVVLYFTVGLLALLALIPIMFFMAIVAILWGTFVLHLKNARRDHRMDFS